ncbi:DUF1835 domain-containing protein [Parasegetibacter sp. NRK P23]|uniref:DUF1835 domain-containing protein n=1 Tax=Parasegetibacter sp. NRK P23 TaxID=2942999 RepID=UPI0020435ED0|nr:DUF1835 domain-containing protein [Parasegetibacter sp. NRK P23]MCM5528442.1 DUF1835 domain-containing protein [Parasegetibacter sp. NRK P23]
MIHIVFNEADVAILEKAIEINDDLEGKVVLIKDDYAVGPLLQGYLGEGRTLRNEWWKTLLAGTEYEGKAESGEVDDFKTVAELSGTMSRDETEKIWIWMAQNQHDVCGYYWLLHFLKPFQGRVFVLYLNNLPFINEKGGIFYPSWISEIPVSEFRKAKKLARVITPSELEVDPDEWKKLMDENGMVRILEGGKKIATKDEDFYDKDILSNCTTDWQKAQRVINNTLHRMKIKTGDVFLGWRLKELVGSGKLEVNGDISKTWKEFEVKLPGSAGSGNEIEA